MSACCKGEGLVERDGKVVDLELQDALRRIAYAADVLDGAPDSLRIAQLMIKHARAVLRGDGEAGLLG